MAPRTVGASVTVGGVAVPVERVAISNGLDQAGATCRVTLPAAVSAADLRADGPQPVVVRVGYNGGLAQRFVGTSRADSPAARPERNELSAVGPLGALAEGARAGGSFGHTAGYPRVSYGTTDTAIAAALLGLAGLDGAQYSVAGDDVVVGGYSPLRVGRAEGELLSALRRLDGLTDYWTADQQGSGVISRRKWPHDDPAAVVVGTLAEDPSGAERALLVPLDWSRDAGAVRNAQLVLGYTRSRDDADADGYYNRPYAALRVASPFVPTPPAYRWGAPVQDDLVETGTHAVALCASLLGRRNILGGQLSALVEGASDYEVGQLWELRAAVLGQAVALPVVLGAISEDVTLGHWTATLTLLPFWGGLGEAVDPRPYAGFTRTGLAVMGAEYGAGGAVIQCDGDAGSAVSDGPFTFHWFNDRNGTEKSGASETTYVVAFTEDELAAGATIYLEVEDPATRLRTLTTGGSGGFLFGGTPPESAIPPDTSTPVEATTYAADDWEGGYPAPPDTTLYVSTALGLVSGPGGALVVAGG